MRVHFILFGTYEAIINGQGMTVDYNRTKEPRLTLEFENGSVRLFTCSVKYIESAIARSTDDLTVDVLSSSWDPKQVLAAMQVYSDEQIGDVLLDQTIFLEVGNISKNELLWIARLHQKYL